MIIITRIMIVIITKAIALTIMLMIGTVLLKLIVDMIEGIAIIIIIIIVSMVMIILT